MRLGTPFQSKSKGLIQNQAQKSFVVNPLPHLRQNVVAPLLFQGQEKDKEVISFPEEKRPSLEDVLSDRELLEIKQVPINDVESALDKIGDIRRKDRNGETLLHALVLRPYVIQKLLDRGLDPNITDSTGNTALHYACRQQVIPSVRMLLKAGANPNLRNHEKDSPLHLNMIHSRQMIPIATELLSAGAKVNRLNADRNTPLIEAVHMGDEALVELLLQHHARINQHGNMGTT
ncbi:MAG: ankyrin repeat domain-containing protein, partial [Cyanobacteria bacterium]|nr:ankyrin repeat domain-containing protein [Cyanobacteriota bacterium]